MPVLQKSDTYIYIHRTEKPGEIQSDVKHMPAGQDTAKVISLLDYRSDKAVQQETQVDELSGQNFSMLLMAQGILGEQKELPEDFIAPLNQTMMKIGKDKPSKPRF